MNFNTHDIAFELHDNITNIAIVGSFGCGKTTFFNDLQRSIRKK